MVTRASRLKTSVTDAAVAVGQTSTLDFRCVPIVTLKPNPNNARVHPKRQIRDIARSYQAYGVINPVIVGPDLTILAGHGRYAAALELGLTELKVLVVEGLTSAQLRAYALADNKLGDASSFDPQLVLQEIEAIALDDASFDITLTGFATAEIDGFVGAARTAELNDLADDPIVPAQGPVVARLGDIWNLGDHRLACGDARDAELMKALIEDRPVRLLLSDVPFNLKIKGVVSGLGRRKHTEFAMASGEMSRPEFVAFLQAAIGATAPHLINGAMVMAFIDWRHVGDLLEAGVASSLELKNILVWVKDNAGMGSLWRSQHELIVAFKHGREPHVNNVELGKHGRHRSNVLRYSGMNSLAKGRAKALELHATVKPVALIADLILDVTNRGDIVVDPFGGSGTTIIAAEKTARRAYLVEIAPGFVDVSVRRWQALTGRDAILTATGQSFAAVAAERLPSAGTNDVATVAGRAIDTGAA